MENENYKKKTTAPDTSVGADDGQPLHNSTENSISAFKEKINGDFQNSAESLDEIYRRIQRLTDPHYLHTISMTELYQTAYQSRPPIIDGLLYAGAYILAGAPKIGKSFLVAQIAYLRCILKAHKLAVEDPGFVVEFLKGDNDIWQRTVPEQKGVRHCWQYQKIAERIFADIPQQSRPSGLIMLHETRTPFVMMIEAARPS